MTFSLKRNLFTWQTQKRQVGKIKPNPSPNTHRVFLKSAFTQRHIIVNLNNLHCIYITKVIFQVTLPEITNIFNKYKHCQNPDKNWISCLQCERQSFPSKANLHVACKHMQSKHISYDLAIFSTQASLKIFTMRYCLARQTDSIVPWR